MRNVIEEIKPSGVKIMGLTAVDWGILKEMIERANREQLKRIKDLAIYELCIKEVRK